jgi:ATP adenylyltransferase
MSAMQSRPLFAPWRMDYIRQVVKGEDDDKCFICQAAAAAAGTEDERRRLLTLWATTDTVVLVNRYPYTNGHLLVAPRAHKPDLEDLTEAEQLDLQRQTTEAVRLLKRAMSPQGFNIGVNIGRCAGAGLPGHLHQHVVPRWNGDTNFMGVVGEVRVVPQAMSQLWEELVRVRKELSH